MNIIGHKYIFLGIAGVLVLASFIALALWGLHLGIDFTGGSLLEVAYHDRVPSPDEVRNVLTSNGVENSLVQPTGDRGMLIRFKQVDEPEHQRILGALSRIGT